MTAKQKANQARFKKVVAEAKKLRKKNPKLTQAQAVKQAWAMTYSKKDVSVGATKKKISANPMDKGRKVEIRPASKYSKKYIVWDLKSDQIFANEKFNSYQEAIDFINQNEMVISGIKRKSAPTKVKAKKGKRTSEMHTDTKSHNVNIRVMSGVKRKRSIGDLPTYKDKDAAREIQLYFQMKRPILINLGNKYKKGTYSIEKAAKLWRYFIDAALKKYNKEFGSRGDKWFELLNTHDRQLLALEYAQETKDEFDLGNFTN